MKIRKFRPTADVLEDRQLMSFGGGNIDFNIPRVPGTSAGLNFTSNSFHQINATVSTVASTILANPSSTNAVLATYVAHIPFGQTTFLPILEADVATFQEGGVTTTTTTATASRTITGLYSDLLMRAPSTAELKAGIGALQGGVTVTTVANVLAQSSEFLAANTTAGATANANHTQFVTALYNDVLGRAPEAGGVSYWVNLLDTAALTDQQVANAFVTSTEAATSTTSAIQAAALTTPADTKYYFGSVVPNGTITGNFPGSSSLAQVENLIQNDTIAYLGNGIGKTFNILKSNVGWASDTLLTYNGRV